MNEILRSSASRIARAIREREVSSEEVVAAFLARIEAVNGRLNAVVALRPEAALEEAREADRRLARGEAPGPLHGVPITVKDSFDTAGVVTTGGTEGLAGHVPEADATAVRRLREAGAVLLGKTNISELTFAYESDNRVYGRTVHPMDPDRTPGGSSGGATAILAAGGSPLDIGSDTGGSIRVPSHFCGTAGLKPTSGRVPRTGHLISYHGAFESLTTIGPLARRVEDLALVVRLLAGPDGRDPYIVPAPLGDPERVDPGALRVAVYADNGIMAADADTEAAVHRAADALASAGARIAEDRPPVEESMDLLYALFGADGGASVLAFLEALGTEEPSLLLQQLLDRLEERAISTAGFFGQVARWDDFRSSMLGWLERYDAVLCPTCAFPAPPHGTTNDDDRLPGFTYASAYNLTGWPVTVVRAGTSAEGLPIGVQIVAPPWREDICLAAAARIEAELGGWTPPEDLA